MKSLAVLISGTGTNMAALLEASSSDVDFGGEVTVVISDRSGAAGLAKAEAAGVATAVIEWSEFSDRDQFTATLCDTAAAYGSEALILAGFMRVLSSEAMERFPDAILNVHPALLPSFPGAHAIDEALAYGVKTTGVTVHFVDELVDHGAIIAQRPVAVEPADDRDSLHRRIQAVEHELFPDCVKAFCHGRLERRGRQVVWKDRP